MHLFITAGMMPHLRVRRLLATWYLRGADDFELAEYARPFRKAVAMLIADLREDRHGRALTIVLDGLEREFRAAETPPPRWLGWLRRLVPPPPDAEPAE